MLPNQQPPGAPPAPPAGAGPQGPVPQGQADIPPDQARQMLVEIMKRAKMIAQQYGFNLAELMQEGGQPTPAPRPPQAPPPPSE